MGKMEELQNKKLMMKLEAIKANTITAYNP
jgi:hypothetical protein